MYIGVSDSTFGSCLKTSCSVAANEFWEQSNSISVDETVGYMLKSLPVEVLLGMLREIASLSVCQAADCRWRTRKLSEEQSDVDSRKQLGKTRNVYWKYEHSRSFFDPIITVCVRAHAVLRVIYEK